MPSPFRQLLIRKGPKSDLPVLANGEMGFCEDTGELFIGSASNGNIKINRDYLPGAPSNWNSPAPSNVNQALDRLAAAVRGILGGPIP